MASSAGRGRRFSHNGGKETSCNSTHLAKASEHKPKKKKGDHNVWFKRRGLRPPRSPELISFELRFPCSNHVWEGGQEWEAGYPYRGKGR